MLAVLKFTLILQFSCVKTNYLTIRNVFLGSGATGPGPDACLRARPADKEMVRT